MLDELGLEPEPGQPARADPARLAREEREYALADALLCPSDFVARTFRERGVPAAPPAAPPLRLRPGALRRRIRAAG